MSDDDSRTEPVARVRPPKRTCGMEYDKDPTIPSCLPDIGTPVKYKGNGGTIGFVVYYEYYVRGQKTFPVQFASGVQIMTMSDVEVVDRAVVNAPRQRVLDLAEARSRRSREKSSRRWAKEEGTEEVGEEVSSRGVC
jgi:hypothetical protein